MIDDDARIEAGTRALVVRFDAVRVRADHYALIDDARTRQQIEWLRRSRRALWGEVLYPAIRAAWARTDPAAQQPGLGL